MVEYSLFLMYPLLCFAKLVIISCDLKGFLLFYSFHIWIIHRGSKHTVKCVLLKKLSTKSLGLNILINANSEERYATHNQLCHFHFWLFFLITAICIKSIYKEFRFGNLETIRFGQIFGNIQNDVKVVKCTR